MRTKNIAPILAGLSIALGAGVLIAYAAPELRYAPLAPLPIGTGGATPDTYTLSTYLAGMIKLLIALGAATAVLFAIIGGTQYVASGIAPSAKQDAKNRIMNAFIGLALMLTSYLLLNSINPELIGFNLELKKIELKAQALGEAKKWGDDTLIRDELRVAGIVTNRDSETNHGNCKSIEDTKCTSLFMLPRGAIDAVIALKYACSGWFTTCDVTITGGTESGHQTHGVNIPVVDLRPNENLDKFIKEHATVNKDGSIFKKNVGGCGVKTAPHYYLIDNTSKSRVYTGTYVFESNPDHWHVCYFNK